MSLDNSAQRKMMDDLMKLQGIKREDFLKGLEMPKAEKQAAMPPLPDMETMRRSGAIPLEENTPQPDVPARQPAAKGPADDAAPPPPEVPKQGVHIDDAAPPAPLAPVQTNVQPQQKAPSKVMPR